MNNPEFSPGVLIASPSNPMEVTFDNVVVVNPPNKQWGKDYYKVENVNGIATGNTWPIPPGFKDQTNRRKKLE